LSRDARVKAQWRPASPPPRVQAMRSISALVVSSVLNMSDSDVLLRHLTERVRADVNVLVQLGHISQPQATDFLNSLPGSSSTMPVPSRRLATAPPPALKFARAKALWAYNEQGTEPDLSFSAGDIVEIVSKTNDDWWTGRVNGREGSLTFVSLTIPC
jgi:LAS seventeen-binding protein 1/2